ncbi:MAG TPA: class I SAM-dependent methyltransferase [Gemmataceae bacterium]|jgi:tRNA (cmo5U34)-methyltransferase|nr:class I SAM-dependent methyltransferase [Gemmataceae bacterium]
MKSTPEQIRERFDGDVERFSNLDTGQSATIDAPLVLDLISEAAALMNPDAKAVLDVGCGAGNYTLKLLQQLPGLDVTLVDLSMPMLDRAYQRVGQATRGTVTAVQGDVRDIDLRPAQFDIILAAAVLHHLRGVAEWRAVFTKFHACLKPGGSLWIADLVQHSEPRIQALMWQQYGDYLVHFKGEAYRDHVFAYVEQEDTPRPLLFQTDLLREVGFRRVEVLHKNSCFAAFAAFN